LLDLQLPGQDGLSVLQALRARGDNVPVLILTARASVPDRVLGLNMGADDYLPKPFDLSELEARLQALLRRPGRTPSALLRLGPLEMDPDSGVVQLQGQVVALTPRELSALRVLLASPKRPVSKESLHEQVFALEDTALDAVEVLVYRLRKKLELAAAGPGAAVQITTFRGLGYMLTWPAGSGA
jgi:two-component system response regulator TctD